MSDTAEQEYLPVPAQPVGRPTLYTPELAAQICEQLSLGLSLRSVCRRDDMPCIATVFLWFQKHTEFSEQYDKAKEQSAEAHAEDMLDIADDGTNDWMDRNDPENPGYKFNGEHVQRSRLRVDTRKWIASKLKPKKYGDNSRTEHTGEGGGPILLEPAARKQIIAEILRLTGVAPKPDGGT